jgi:hypothetical protein
LQYIGPPENDSHSQTPIGVLQKSSHLGSHSTESNPKAENGVHKNSNAYLKYSYKQAHKNIAIKNGTILINKKGQPVRISLIKNFIAPATNIEMQIPSGTSSGDQAQIVPPSSNAPQNSSRRSIRSRRAPSYYGKNGINAGFATVKSNKRFKKYSDIFLPLISPDSDSRKIMHYVFTIVIQFQKSRLGKLAFKSSSDGYKKGFKDHDAPN